MWTQVGIAPGGADHQGWGLQGGNLGQKHCFLLLECNACMYTCSCMCSKGSGVEFRENAPESVEEEEEGRRLLGSKLARFLLGSLDSRAVLGSLGIRVLGTSLDLG